MADSPNFFVAPAGGGLIAGGIYSAENDPFHPGQTGYVYWGMSTQVAAAAPAGTAASTATGTNQLDTSYQIFGHTVPLSVLGLGRIGGELISGPWRDGDNVSGGISYGHPADPSGTRTLVEVAFDQEVVWRGSQVGPGTLDPAGFTVEPFTCRWYDGKLTQSADAIETAHFGAQANAYRPQMMLFVANLPLGRTKFNRFPYIACKISDGSGTDVNWGEAFQRLAASPWVNFPAFEAVGVTDGLPDGGLIITQDTQFLQLIQQVARFYKWDILQTDKLRIVDRGSTVAADITLDATRLMGAITVARQGQDTTAKELELSTIDPDNDYTILPSLAQRPRDPVAVTTSVGRDAAYLPAIMNASTRMAIATFAKYREETARKTISGTAMAYGLQMEPGALVRIEGLGDDFQDETFKIVETTHGINNVVEFVGQSIFKCDLGAGCSEYEAFIAMTSGLDDAHKDAYRQLICGLVTDGLWDKMEALYIYATQDSTTALLNLKRLTPPITFDSEAHGSPTFTADRGFTGGTSGNNSVYIDTGFSTHGGYTNNSAHMSVWTVTAATDAAMGMTDGAPEVYWYNTIEPRALDGKLYARINSVPVGFTGGPDGFTVASGVGHSLGTRTSSTNVDVYKDGVALGSYTRNSGLTPNNSCFTLAFDGAATAHGGPNQVAAASLGAELNATEVTNFYNRLHTYMAAVGVV